ncbi:MAG: bifunctional riboflavin kinase/FAD synthetase, partial [Deltaproteobacteria bacterium]|nr:bifunctional riboflavin kinase/FAD synthetase [Deltaproteobacteria bacterium]
PPLCDGPREISSSGIREAIEEGNVDLAARWLERPFTLIGRVATGAGRGRTIGIPTANLEPENEFIPRGGVYAGYARLMGSTAENKRTQPWPAVINIGRAPTFEREREIKIEAHLLGFAGDLVGHPLALSFVYHLRPERRFASPEELIAQIQEDIARATERLGIDASSQRR